MGSSDNTDLGTVRQFTDNRFRVKNYSFPDKDGKSLFTSSYSCAYGLVCLRRTTIIGEMSLDLRFFFST